MEFLELICLLFDIFQSWRFSLCVVVGIGLGALILSTIPSETLGWVIASPVSVGFVVMGCWWESR